MGKGDCAFAVVAPKLWKSRLFSIKRSLYIDSFKTKLYVRCRCRCFQWPLVGLSGYNILGFYIVFFYFGCYLFMFFTYCAHFMILPCIFPLPFTVFYWFCCAVHFNVYSTLVNSGFYLNVFYK